MAQMVTFTLRRPGASSVALAGDFNDWDVTTDLMTYDTESDLWTIALRLEPGHYEYKFFVDGREWSNDPHAPTVHNVWGSENSYVDVD